MACETALGGREEMGRKPLRLWLFDGFTRVSRKKLGLRTAYIVDEEKYAGSLRWWKSFLAKEFALSLSEDVLVA